jgi:signal transduction histidine kinase
MAEVSAQQAGFVFTAQGKGQERALVAAAPVRSEDGTRLGTVILEFDAAVHQARLLRALGEVALVSVPGLLLLIPLGWFAGQRLARPLEQLAQALARVGHEPLNTIASRLPPSGGDEIGRLSVQAQLMLDGLARKEALEREMVASERLAAVGRVAAAIAHEVNNPLGGMLNAIDTVGRHGRPDAFTRKTLGLLERGLLQIRSTVSALLVEARLNSPSLQPTDWEDLRMLVEPQLEAKAVRLDWRTDEVADHAVVLPAHEVRQLVLNLLLNAAKAAQPWANENAAVELTAARAPGLLAIVVGNTGPPLSAQALSRLFEPFVLPPGPDLASGSGRFGLGLWVCYQIVQRLGGRVDVQSEHGWTRFSVSLPVSDPLLDPRSDVAPTT